MSIELFDAIHENNIVRVRELIAAGADINSINNSLGNTRHYYYDNTALEIAIFRIHSNMDIIRELINAGANVNTIRDRPYSSYSRIPLHSASTIGNVNAVRALIDAGADVNFKDKLGYNALDIIFEHYSQDHNHYRSNFYPHATQDNMLIIMNMLLDAGTNVNAQNKHKTTNIMNICTSQDISIPPEHNIFDKKIFINALLDRGANIDLQDEYGNTALMMTIGMLDENWINNYKTTINDGHEIPEEFFSEQKVLYIAHFVDLFKFLVSKGANVLLEDNNGETALDIAIEMGNLEIIDILQRVVKAENEAKKNIAVDAFMLSSKNNVSLLPSENTPLTSLYRNFENKYPFLIQNVFEYAYGKDEEENKGADESKSNRGDAGGKRRKSVRKKSKSKKIKSFRRRKSESRRKKSTNRKSGSKRRKSSRK